MHELVSVIITTYMRPPEIVFRAVNSVLNQTYSNIEIILVDDSPVTYEARNILKEELGKLRNKVRYIQHETNSGACAARNTGLYASQGKYVAFLDDDDEWLPEKIEKQYRCFKDMQTALVYCGKMLVDDDSRSIYQSPTDFRSGYVFDTLIYSNFIGSTSFPLIRKDCLAEIGGFDPLMKSAQDYDVWLRLAKKYKVDYVSEPLVKYHVHSGERISTNFQSRISGQERLIQKNMDYLRQHPKAWWWRKLRLALQCGHAMDLKKALQIWATACAKRPQAVVTNVSYLIHIIYACFRSRFMH